MKFSLLYKEKILIVYCLKPFKMTIVSVKKGKLISYQNF